MSVSPCPSSPTFHRLHRGVTRIPPPPLLAMCSEAHPRWPTRRAGPQFPTAPITTPVLRIIPGQPRNTLPAVDWQRSRPNLTSPLTLHARLCQATSASASAHLPDDPAIAAPAWFDFSLTDPVPSSISNTHIEFSISCDKQPLARAVMSLLPSLTTGDPTPFTTPLLNSCGAPIANLHLTVQFITPHPASQKFASKRPKTPFVPRVTGHRGMGSSGQHAPHRPLENSPHSFLQATLPSLANNNRNSTMPITAVELDVQPSSDGSIIVFHDWFYRPRDATTYDLLHDRDTVRIPTHSMTRTQFTEQIRLSFAGKSDEHRRFLPAASEALLSQADEHSIPRTAFETRGRTLHEICDILPVDVGLLLEVKFPAPDVSRRLKLPFAHMDTFVNSVLDDLLSSRGIAERKVAFLCFEADVCAMLALKQDSFPVYLSHCEVLDKPCDEEDPRLTDLREGVYYVRAVGLDGIMMLNELVELRTEVMAELARDDDIAVLTYGKTNSDARVVQRQFEMGVDGVIADDADRMVKEFAALYGGR